MHNSALLCPQCELQLIEVQSPDNYYYHYCPQCQGVLLKPKNLADHAFFLNPENTIDDAKIEINKKIIKPIFVKTQKNCPIDGTALQVINYGYDSNILIEKCSACSSLWVEQAEFLVLARYFKGNPKLKALGVSIAEDIERQNSVESYSQFNGAVLTTVPIPVGDTAETVGFPGVTIGIIVLCCLSLLFQTLFFADTELFFTAFGLVPAKLWQGLDLHGLFTYMFVHLNLQHLISNMLYLWIFGDNVELRLGHAKFMLFFLAAGVFSALVYSLNPINPEFALVGASGAISAVMGGYLLLYPSKNIRIMLWNSFFNIPTWLAITSWIVVQIFSFMLQSSLSESVQNTAFTGHISGFIFGVVVVWILKSIRGGLIQELNIYQR